jgi:hypothetical protein
VKAKIRVRGQSEILRRQRLGNGKASNIAGSALITTRQFAELVFSAVHQKLRLRVAGKFMLRVLGLFTPFLRELVEMHYLWTTPVKLDDTRLLQLLSNLHKTPYAEGIRTRFGPALL